MMALSGVRSSWLMFARNALLAREASSAATFASVRIVLGSASFRDLEFQRRGSLPHVFLEPIVRVDELCVLGFNRAEHGVEGVDQGAGLVVVGATSPQRVVLRGRDLTCGLRQVDEWAPNRLLEHRRQDVCRQRDQGDDDGEYRPHTV